VISYPGGLHGSTSSSIALHGQVMARL